MSDEESNISALGGGGSGEGQSAACALLEELIIGVTRASLLLERAEAGEMKVCRDWVRRLKADVSALPETARERPGVGFRPVKRTKRRRSG